MNSNENPAARKSAGPSITGVAHPDSSVAASQTDSAANAEMCPNCLEFFFRGHLEGQAHARAVDEDMADKVARHIRALELEHEANRQLARAAIRAIDTQTARRAPGSSYVPMARPERGAP